MITKESLSIASLMEVLKTAYVEASLDPDGDILSKEDYRVYVQVPAGADSIRFLTQFASSAGASRDGLLEYANRVNAQLRVPRAYLIDAEGRRSIVIDEYVYVDAGLAEASFISALRRFHRSLRSAVDQDTDNVLG